MIDRQLALGVSLKDNARLDNFLPGNNQELVAQLETIALSGGDTQLFLWAGKGQGKTHLLQATCQQAVGLERAVFYLPLKEYTSLSSSILDGLSEMQLVCIDDIDFIAGDEQWEEALFNCYNQLRDCAVPLVVSSTAPPAQLPFKLADLRSRFEWGLVYNLQPLSDEQRLQALQLRARGRGLELPEDTGQYLIRRVPRDMPALFTLLDRLDEASLSAQRKLTIPFVKTVMDA